MYIEPCNYNNILIFTMYKEKTPILPMHAHVASKYIHLSLAAPRIQEKAALLHNHLSSLHIDYSVSGS